MLLLKSTKEYLLFVASTEIVTPDQKNLFSETRDTTMAGKPAHRPAAQWAVDMKSDPPRPTKGNIPDPPGYSSSKGLTKQVCFSSTLYSLLTCDPQLTANVSQTQQRQQQQQQQQASTSTRKSAETDALKLKKAWEMALSPSKQLPMNAIMMYMSGNSLQIFSIMMVFMLFKGPIQGLLNTNSAFAKFETESTRTQMLGAKLVYMLMQCVLLALGIWKVNAMGLLPYVGLPFSLLQDHRALRLTDNTHRTTRSDWLAWETEREPLEHAYFAFR